MILKNMTSQFLGLLALAVLWSCGPKISSTVKTDKNLSAYETYAYLPNSSISSLDKTNQSENVGEDIIAAMNRNMQEAGYTMNRQDPDLLVVINTNYDRETDVNVDRDLYYDYNYAYYPYTTALPVNNYYNDNYYYGYDSYNDIIDYDLTLERYTDADMVVSLVDKDTRNIVWTGSVDDFYTYQSRPTEEVADFVDDIFDDYPTLTQK
ncbi:DUF4136 domain-containing protein [Maribacter sp. 2307ULW6-5]|uniref:DUF4136 domain-containing protein n=1 Tax=Maribacter sp. 2307ULW6-5 TaxID=3386275 RepID=UPI0039BCB207